MKDWDATLEGEANDARPDNTWLRAHKTFLRDVLVPDRADQERGRGARMAVAIPAAHVPSFLRQGTYRNAYQTSWGPRIGANNPAVSTTREFVDSMLPLPPDQSPQNTYFGAVETTGCGVRYYGDLCLVLKPSAVPGDATILDRNSYDLVRPPLETKWRRRSGVGAAPMHAWTVTQRARAMQAGSIVASDLAGRFHDNLVTIVATNMRNRKQLPERALTVGEVAEGVLNDEDYVEILKKGSFSAHDVDEVRTSAGDAAAESLIADRAAQGPAPSHAELLWRNQRRRATAALLDRGLGVRIVVSSGRVRG